MSMASVIQGNGTIKYALSANDTFVAAVEPGETFKVECAINVNDGTIRHVGQQLSLGRRHPALRQRRHRPDRGQGCQARRHADRRGARHEASTGWASRSLWPGIGIFPDWVRHKEFGIQTQVVEVKDGLVHWNDTLKLPRSAR